MLSWQSARFEQQVALKTQFIEEKNALRDDLDDLIDEHELLKDEHIELNNQLHERDSAIRAYTADIKKLLRSEGELKEAKRNPKKMLEVQKSWRGALLKKFFSLLRLFSKKSSF